MDFSSPFDLPNSFQANPNPMHAFFLRHGATSILTPEDSLSKSEHIAPLESSIGEEESKSQVATPAKESSEPAKESIEPSSSKENENAGPFKIKKASVPFNGVYLEFSEIAAADDYKVYVKGVSDSVWVRVDNEFLRNYGSYRRVDVLGLKKVPTLLESMPSKTAASLVPCSLTIYSPPLLPATAMPSRMTISPAPITKTAP